ncbi:MAG TPA: S-methyl-5-thioribose-1-phosphate isomerase [Firmicutes bacterium]|nr:S-methyl-5-thioribose-1-phosphate isomerase [Candidatus Fermentithermobacillaceae bacterium]
MIPAIKWENKVLYLLDQRIIPWEIQYVECRDFRQTSKCIKDMVVRGAPAIGIAGGYGVALAVKEAVEKDYPNPEDFLNQAAQCLVSSRPTAVNLKWAVDRVLSKGLDAFNRYGPEESLELAVQEAITIHNEDVEMNYQIGRNGSLLIKPGSNVLTHCNAGALATGGWGTALGVIRQAQSEGKIRKVYVDETRPFLQGSRLTAWELEQDDIDVTVLVDGAAGYLLSLGEVDAVIVGADRIGANGDVANKIGTYSLACLCEHHNIPFYVAAPVSTFDLTIRSGREIPIEHRDELEVLEFLGKRVAPYGVKGFNPSFDVTPNRMVSAIITELGNIFAPFEENIKKIIS